MKCAEVHNLTEGSELEAERKTVMTIHVYPERQKEEQDEVLDVEAGSEAVKRGALKEANQRTLSRKEITLRQ
ncbi:MAG: hypothetical protein NC114_10600 [Ruminococcus flavefaciens]|nr:hypothetical protein [Ruminococcus flavefaciens]